MKGLDDLNKCKEILIEYENIIFAYIFGSYVQKNMRKDSDVDIAIYLSEEISTETYLKIKMELSEIFQAEIDLVILNDSTPLLKYEIYKNNILLFTRDENIETRYNVKT